MHTAVRGGRKDALVSATLTAVVSSILLIAGPGPADAPAHLYRALLVRDGALVWDNLWFAGQYPLASYSLLYYLPAAVVGNLPLVLGAAIASTLLFSTVARREFGDAALWPSRAFAVLAAAPMFTGLYAYSVNFAGLLAVCTAGGLLAARTPRGRPIVLLFTLWAAGSVVLFLIPTPFGDNWARMSAFVFPVALLTASLARWQPRWLSTWIHRFA